MAFYPTWPRPVSFKRWLGISVTGARPAKTVMASLEVKSFQRTKNVTTPASLKRQVPAKNGHDVLTSLPLHEGFGEVPISVRQVIRKVARLCSVLGTFVWIEQVEICV